MRKTNRDVEHRRQQNRLSQQRYRQRQKQRLEELEACLAAGPGRVKSGNETSTPSSEVHEKVSGSDTTSRTGPQRQRVLLPYVASPALMAPIVTPSSPAALAAHATIAPTADQVCVGDTTVDSCAATSPPNEASCAHGLLNDPNVNQLITAYDRLVLACLDNAVCLGTDRAAAHQLMCPSPFISRQWDLAAYFDLAHDLKPCELQVKLPHPIWIDTIPLPRFRSAVLYLLWSLSLSSQVGGGHGEADAQSLILASAVQNPAGGSSLWGDRGQRLLRELATDLDSGGIIYRGSFDEPLRGLPWQKQSWKIEPWFGIKWAWMLQGR